MNYVLSLTYSSARSWISSTVSASDRSPGKVRLGLFTHDFQQVIVIPINCICIVVKLHDLVVLFLGYGIVAYIIGIEIRDSGIYKFRKLLAVL